MSPLMWLVAIKLVLLALMVLDKFHFNEMSLGIEEYDTGRISIDSVDTIGYMQQQSDFTHDNLYDELLSAFADIIALGQKKTTLEKQIES